MFAVTILGNNSAVPAFNRHPTSQVVTIDGHNYLVDCGEGTQIQLINYKIRRSKISHIFISHLHGDHYFGLIGLLNSFGLLSHQQELHVFGPSPLKEIIELQLKVADTKLCYDLHIHHITEAATLVDNEKLRVKCFRTNHRIECYGFSFEQKKQPRKLNIEKAKEFEIPANFYDRLKSGEDYTKKDGSIIKNELVTETAEPGKKYVFCADTKYDESLLPHIQDADLIYHETTYLDNLRERAEERFHSTTKQAAELALKGGVKKLLIGHFSSKYDTLEEFEAEAREVFPNTELALEGVCFEV
ncbi:MAG TPA: ribonuclease Z [Chitinophagaceae bacterium]|nr:ribonuclease Z [Chitinophagaceae bacterium]MBP7109632.1 ribonuclease Z [Chitinophagaceae bacterium]MBP7315708.1 ribonuclease Z [Chitinophagaceae bacterium]HQV55558.1 ribonuclease Z [Chitinophagaceae bacterium]HQX96001.1 ribonuclease Z [Chitinophagaceae bacterium]